MTITAKFPGRCTVCDRAIEPGQKIEWTKGSPAVHARCARDGAVVESGPGPRNDRSGTAFPPTAEQDHALALFATGDSLAIEAGAGTGKTSTLLLLARSTRRRGQYVAFNRAIVAEGKTKFPDNVACNTAHSLAMRAYGVRFAERLRTSRRMKSIEIANRLGIEPVEVDKPGGRGEVSRSFLGGLALASIRRFCQSADPVPTRRHVPYIEGIDRVEDGVRSYANNEIVARSLEPTLRRMWADLTTTTGWLPYTHDHYLKAWQLDDPRIDAEFILFDEAQDANPVMVAIVAAQTHAQLVWVGDSQQQIYSFTGAINALASVPAESRAFLTQSFRFGPAIAETANEILDRLPDAELRLVGTETIDSVVEPVEDPDAILSRTNAEAVRTVLRYQREGRTAALVGGGDDVVRFAKAARELMETGRTDYPDLACFDSWMEVREYVEADEMGGDLRLLVKLVEDFGVETILDALDRVVREEDADVVVSTAHKAKGREWEAVRLAGDFPPPEKIGDEEYRLLYVAATRARRRLDIEAVAVLREDAEEGAVASASVNLPAPEPERDGSVEEFLTRVTRPDDLFDVVVNREVETHHVNLNDALVEAQEALIGGARQSAVYAIHADGTNDLVIEWDD